MKTFANVQFKWTFRDYQQRVLDNANKFLSDGKINIVAAPGSGKTILGLELIRRLGNPCIILSPTTTIRQQWGSRFAESFLADASEVEEYCSYDLRKIKLINCITYQALYSAVDRIATSTSDEEIDYSNVELFSLIKQYGIRTVCLDEAHHLQNEWQKALEKFLKGLSGVTIISLTATPPYDSSLTEWNRYVSTCGEIDDEIFVPELVKEGTLCPHQDYVIFNYPTQQEVAKFQTHRNNIVVALEEIGNFAFIKTLCESLPNLYRDNQSFFYENYAGMVALMIFMHSAGLKPDEKLFKTITKAKTFPKLENHHAQKAVELLVNTSLLYESDKEIVLNVLKKYGLYDKRTVNLDLTDKLKRSLVTSSGKLKSIASIVKHEYASMQKQLRMLILTDYIKKDAVQNIGKDFTFENLSVVSIFETVRKFDEVDVACLSGSLVILPQKVASNLPISVVSKVENLENTRYAVVTFRGSNREKVDIVSQMFQDGQLQVLVGTQALLGEGWDSPCINSLIMASYVGSFMLSNQMRGRAIRSVRNNPEKTANIWHLVTLEPEYLFKNDATHQQLQSMQNGDQEISSADFQTLSRRFEGFVGPNYETGEIESGIERLSCIHPPYTQKNVQQINDNMFALASDRDNLRKSWSNALAQGSRTVFESQIPSQCRVPAFTFLDVAGLALCSAVFAVLVVVMFSIMHSVAENGRWLLFGLLLLLIFGTVVLADKLLVKIIKHRSPKKSISNVAKAVLKTLEELDLVKSGAKLHVDSDESGLLVMLYLTNATIHEQNIFNTATTELLSPIDNPRYVLVQQNKKGKYNYKLSFASPSVFSKNSDTQEVFAKNLRKVVDDMRSVYVHSESGRKVLLKCRQKSFINENERRITKRQRVSKFD